MNTVNAIQLRLASIDAALRLASIGAANNKTARPPRPADIIGYAKHIQQYVETGQ